MVRLGMKFAFAVLLAAGLAVVALQADGQATSPQSSPANPQSAPANPPSPALRSQPGPSPQRPMPSPQAQAPTTPQRPVQSPQAQTQAAAQSSQPATTTRPASTTSKKRAHGKTAVAETAPAPPPPPPTLEQTPPTAPNVTLRNGELTIDAQNSTLSQVLHAVQTLTGASVEIPGGASSERVVTHLGPGQPSDVLKTLLNGSKFDYVILGVNGDPGGVQKIILTPRQAVGTVTAQNNQPTPQPAQDQSEESPIAENDENQEQPPPPPAGGFRRPGMPNQPLGQANNNNNTSSGDAQNSFAGPGGEAQQNGAKTPEQLMQELQQMQEQQQQYQQQLNPANRTPQQ
jgi:hypothetical protein